MGHEFLEAENGMVALDLLFAERGNVDLILLDWIMPVLNGYETLVKIKEKEEYANIPVIMVTTESEDSKMRQAIQSGAVDFISKPFEAEDLEEVLKKYL
jgi:two-component system chemotaxis response regulator CheY